MPKRSRLDDALLARIQEEVERRGQPVATLALNPEIGIPSSTFYSWVRRGRADAEAGRKTRHAELYLLVEAAPDLYLDRVQQAIEQAAKTKSVPYVLLGLHKQFVNRLEHRRKNEAREAERRARKRQLAIAEEQLRIERERWELQKAAQEGADAEAAGPPMVPLPDQSVEEWEARHAHLVEPKP